MEKFAFLGRKFKSISALLRTTNQSIEKPHLALSSSMIFGEETQDTYESYIMQRSLSISL